MKRCLMKKAALLILMALSLNLMGCVDLISQESQMDSRHAALSLQEAQQEHGFDQEEIQKILEELEKKDFLDPYEFEMMQELKKIMRDQRLKKTI